MTNSVHRKLIFAAIVLATIFLIALIINYRHNHTTLSDRLPDREINEEDRVVYTAAFLALGHEKWGHHYLFNVTESDTRRWGLRTDSLVKMGISEELVKEFDRVNREQRVIVDNALFVVNKISIVDVAQLQRYYLDASVPYFDFEHWWESLTDKGRLWFPTRVAYNGDRTKAILVLAAQMNTRETSGYVFKYSLIAGRWEVEHIHELWF